ncbi:SIS domain-containing protein [Solimonas marina]|uniref:SIS domain-containing protein n=1 Tax=Solimonas marina TaxID=2714601 RepID=A0A969WG49_9GAMM|nr:SIS domain-containing protein [Solimonas marina]NKF24090.1 SIS domain-containing protein [Solimonas marina]
MSGARQKTSGDDALRSPLLARIAAAQDGLRKSERTVAEFVLAQPSIVLNLSIAELAARTGVSQPTVARFAAALGFSGYREFKLRLAQSLASGLPFIHQDVGPDDALELVAPKVFDRAIGGLIDVRNHLDSAALARAVKLLAKARRIDFCGIGNSGIVALDGQHKFFRYGMPCIAYIDTHAMLMAATVVGRGDAVVAISATGRTTDMLAAAEIARESGAAVIAITASDSPLARLATVTLAADVAEDADIYSPMISRIAHLAIVDVLAVGTALALGPPLLKRLERGKRTLHDKRVHRVES